MGINLSYDQLNNEYSMLMSVLGASVSKHLMDEHFTCIWANDFYYELIGYPKKLYEALFHNHCDEYFRGNQEGWDKLVNKVSSALEKGEKSYSVYLPMVHPEKGDFWIRMQAVFTDEYIDGCRVAYTIMTDVTEVMEARLERDHTQQVFVKMTQEQELLMSALNVSVSKHLIDEHYTCVRANEYYYKLIGYPKQKYEALFHNHCDEYYGNNPEGWELLTKTVGSVLERGEDGYELIVPMKYEDGSSYWVKLVSFFTDEYIDGYRISYTVMTDVTELVQMKNEQELLMRAMKVSVSKHLVDEHFTVVWANEFYYQLIGYSKNEYESLFHNHCDEYFQFNAGGFDLIQRKVEAMMASEQESFELFLPLRIPDGSSRWVKLVGFFTDEYQDGKRLAYTTMIDVTELMEAQKEKTIAYDNIPGFVVKHRILPDRIMMIEASDRIKDIFEVNMDDLSSLDPLKILQPESREVIVAWHAQLRRGEPFEGTICAKDKYGKDRWFRIHSTCVDFIAEDPVYLTILIDVTDITELRELKRKLEERTRMLNNALEEAKQANAAKSDFLSRMSHDIRTPMNVIAGMTEIADSHLNEPERVRDSLQKIRLSSHHLLGLVNDVLDMSKIENGDFPISAETVSLPEVLREVIMITLAGVREKRQIFNVHLLEVEQEEVYSDALRLRQILLNLLSNASKFTPEGGRIAFDVEQLPQSQPETVLVRFTVSDTGMGIKPEFLDYVFDAFTREQDSRTDRIEGSGLGMAITKKLVDLMGGTITVRSNPGEGSTFEVDLPMKRGRARQAERIAAGMNILLADADPAARTYGLRALATLGAAVECADSGMEAAGKVCAGRQSGRDYQLVILDADMSGMEDFSAVRRIKEDGGADGPLLILAAYDWGGVKDEAAAAGIDGFVEKPLFPSTLEDCLRRQLRGEERQERQAAVYDFNGKTFLLVEDNELNREIALELLGSMGAGMETAGDGQEAVERFRNSAPGYYALILMDIQMPVMNGYEAARAIRALDREDAGTVPIIAMTADAFVEDIHSAEAAGMNGHMAKPLDFEVLAREISRYLR